MTTGALITNEAQVVEEKQETRNMNDSSGMIKGNINNLINITTKTNMQRKQLKLKIIKPRKN